MRRTVIASLLAFSLPATAGAADNLFELGTIQVTADPPEVGEVATEQAASVVTLDDIRTYNRETVGEAVNLLPGVTLSNGVRNELTVYLRGYDPRQTPLFIDGIPVYVPYDGYVDFGRFDTADLAAIQVAKGYSSVVYGPNTLGGAINLISRKPAKAFEGDARAGVGAEGGRRAAVNLGTNQGSWYVQAGASYREADGYRLSGDFTPTATEDGGRRENAYYKDSKGSVKLGLTPGGDDEYTLTYIKQDGEKGQPPSTDPASARYWQWPDWDKESLYFISRTALGALETLKLRLYLDNFDNELDIYADAGYSGLTEANRSIYHDKSRGGSIELESRRFANQVLRMVAHYKNDRHENVDGTGALLEDFKDNLRSLSLEDSIAVGKRSQVVVGVAHHELRPDEVYKSGWTFTLPDSQSATDPQLGYYLDLDPSARLYATVAQKTRLPTLKDRYSLRFGRYVENPDLRKEEATNYEAGYQGRPWPGAKAEAALFWNEIDDKIQSVNLNGAASCSSTNKCQMQNVGEARVRGIELSLNTALGGQWQVGGSATWLNLSNLSDPTVRLTGIPRTKFILHATWRPNDRFDVVALAERDGGRWASDTVELDGYTTLNLKVVWHPLKDLSAEAGVNNATDQNYELDYGFPAAGRMWFANLNYAF